MLRALGWSQNKFALQDRRMIREKIAEVPTETPEMVASLDEEFMEHVSTSRMQYPKNGCQVRGRRRPSAV